jgi:hypothetical protein
MKVKFGGTPFQACRSLSQRTLFHDPDRVLEDRVLLQTRMAANAVPTSTNDTGSGVAEVLLPVAKCRERTVLATVRA